MKVKFLPKTTPGKWSAGLTAGLIVFFLIARLIVASGQQGGETFFDTPAISIPMALAATCGVAAFIVGLAGIIRNKERSILVFITTLIGLFVLIFIIGEFASPH
jgi:hypothetical protein